VASLVLAVLAILQAFPFDQYVLGLTASILVPIWAVWLAMPPRACGNDVATRASAR
jgi:hypothetical protein